MSRASDGDCAALHDGRRLAGAARAARRCPCRHAAAAVPGRVGVAFRLPITCSSRSATLLVRNTTSALPSFHPAGGHGHHDSVAHAGLTIHKAASWHKYTGQAFAGLMWCVECGCCVSAAHQDGRLLLLLRSTRVRIRAVRSWFGALPAAAASSGLTSPLHLATFARRFWVFYRFYNDFDTFVVSAAQQGNR